MSTSTRSGPSRTARVVPAPRLTAARARRRVQALREQIRRHDHRYYVLDRPTISDASYDALVRELAALEGRFPDLVAADSPTQRVAGEVRKGFRTVPHHAPLLSLDSTTDPDAVRQFDARVRSTAGPSLRYVLEPKFDGLSIEVVYRDGRLVSASTRGDGDRGEDVTANVRTIRAVPLSLAPSARPAPRLLAVRGEVLMRRNDFAALNRRLQKAAQPLFANPRNAAAGSVRQLDPRITATRRLSVCFYDVLAIDGRAKAPSASVYDEWMHAWGLPVSPRRRLGATAADILAYRKTMARARASLDVEIDGVVAKVDDLAARRRLGSTARHPRWAIGVKFEARAATTRLERIEWQIGRTGVLTPVAILRPVEIGGVTVSRATLHNWRELVRRHLRVGDTVEVIRAGDVIPEILGRVAAARRGRALPRRPRACPACGARVVEMGPSAVCPNTLACPAQRVRAIQHFASRGAFDIDGLGPSTVQLLVDRALVHTAADLFTLTDADLRGLPRFGAVAAARLSSAIGAARHVTLDRFLVALGIPAVGASTARRLAARLRTLDAVRRASTVQLAAVSGVGPAVARQVVAFFRRPDSRAVVDALLRHGVVPAASRRTAAGVLLGQSVAFTGTLETMTRAEAERLVERLGGRAAQRVTRATDLLVTGSAPGSKLDRARELGIPIATESAFLRRYRSPRRAS